MSRYTREVLVEAAMSSETLSEVLEKLGLEPKGPSRNYIRERMKRMNVDTSHFAREGITWTKDVLEAAVAASTSVNEVLRRLGLDPVGGHHTHISRRIKAHEIDVSHFTSAIRTAGAKGTGRRRAAQDILLESASELTGRKQGSRLKKAMRGLGVEECCALCGTGPVWLGEPLPLEVDHIDGDWRNNRIDNLRLLCPNCHAITSTWCRGNAKPQTALR